MEHLDNFSDNQLEDIIENYKLYRYDESVKRHAITLLAQRNVNKLKNSQPGAEALNKEVREVALKRRRKLLSKFIGYGGATLVLWGLIIAGFYLVNSYSGLANFVVIFILFVVCYSLTFVNYRRYYEHLNLTQLAVSGWLFLFLGTSVLPFFLIIIYNRMNRHINVYFS